MGMGKSLRFAERPLRLRTSFGNSFWLGRANSTRIEAPDPVSGFVGMPRGRDPQATFTEQRLDPRESFTRWLLGWHLRRPHRHLERKSSRGSLLIRLACRCGWGWRRRLGVRVVCPSGIEDVDEGL